MMVQLAVALLVLSALERAVGLDNIDLHDSLPEKPASQKGRLSLQNTGKSVGRWRVVGFGAPARARLRRGCPYTCFRGCTFKPLRGLFYKSDPGSRRARFDPSERRCVVNTHGPTSNTLVNY